MNYLFMMFYHIYLSLYDIFNTSTYQNHAWLRVFQSRLLLKALSLMGHCIDFIYEQEEY